MHCIVVSLPYAQATFGGKAYPPNAGKVSAGTSNKYPNGVVRVLQHTGRTAFPPYQLFRLDLGGLVYIEWAVAYFGARAALFFKTSKTVQSRRRNDDDSFRPQRERNDLRRTEPVTIVVEAIHS